MARGQPLPHVALLPASEGQSDEERKGHKVLASLFLLGGGGCVPDAMFVRGLDYVMPSWDPLRKHPHFAKELLVPGLKLEESKRRGWQGAWTTSGAAMSAHEIDLMLFKGFDMMAGDKSRNRYASRLCLSPALSLSLCVAVLGTTLTFGGALFL